MSRILAIETSCDDTCAAVLDGRRVLSSIVSSQDELHSRFGGIVPEVASRRHLELINPVIDTALEEAAVALDDVDAIAVTTKPGLIGALLVGVNSAKALAAASGKPLIAVDHMQGHIAAAFIEPEPIEPPFLALIASGGHTLLADVTEHGSHRVLGRTLDDAAGEALDKAARLLGLGYPGGPAIQREAPAGDPESFSFPIAMSRGGGLDFSFSGLKTSLVYAVEDLGPERTRERRADLAASFQSAVVGQLITKLERAMETFGPHERSTVALGGGVAANALLREQAAKLCEERGVMLKLVPTELCTDNAAMIASAARFAEVLPYPDYLGLDATPR